MVSNIDSKTGTLIEANVGIICACLPILKSPFMRGMTKIFGRTDQASDRQPDWKSGGDDESDSKAYSTKRQSSWAVGLKSKHMQSAYESGSVELLHSDVKPLHPRTHGTQRWECDDAPRSRHP